ncbi:MAG: ABC transporter ATP-binding protein [Lachnospiraceae bacterium]|nr:ABC transporter ATP-binding protein [Lachnospiraceae bacterium]
MLKINHLTKHYKGSSKGVTDISLHVEKGDIFAFIGHNGAGKTTTLKCITGIHDFEQGEILIDGVSLQKEPLKCKQSFAYIPDNPDLYEYLTGIQYLNFVADVFQVSAKEREERIHKYADAFEITASLGDLISSYSHGMKQKLAIISALVHTPKLLILDEPFVGLDPKAAVMLKGMMKELCEAGGAIFFSTHVLEVAEKLCNKVAIIKDGQMIAQGDMEELVKEDETLETVFMEVLSDVGANEAADEAGTV